MVFPIRSSSALNRSKSNPSGPSGSGSTGLLPPSSLSSPSWRVRASINRMRPPTIKAAPAAIPKTQSIAVRIDQRDMLPRSLFEIGVADHLYKHPSELPMAAFLEGLDYNPFADMVRSLDEGRPIGELLKLLKIERHDAEFRHTVFWREGCTERLGVHPLGTVQDVKCTEP